uniref:N-acetyltransferase domain-containing protein n=1 Tax=Kwoniella pini CBS 10737 TaxID=1296096 RepID=A0A1B9HVZ1_9TREE|nr:uncharacterized protein I206_06343 [Kwoniella pini CBS 10737]OCF47442.1 hypothetical protein I206_06343 [Kwoniella pini CBS 10737]
MSSSSTSSKIRPPFTLKVAETKDEIEACYDIRIEVFSVEQGFPLETEIDEYDPISIHFLLSISIPSPPLEQSINSTSSSSSSSSITNNKQTTEKPIGTIRYVPKTSKLSRLAIDKEFRKFGFGKILVEGMHNWIKSNYLSNNLNIIKTNDGKKFIKIKCHSQIPVIPFYEKLGYISEGQEFDEEGGKSK